MLLLYCGMSKEALMRYKDAQEQLIAEQAVLHYRAVCEAAEQAAFGHGMEAMETAALEAGREHIARLIQTTANQRAASEKATRRGARIAADRPDSNAPRRDR